MTTLVTVKANGACYPARLIKRDKDGKETHNELVASGHTVELWVGTQESISVTEEHHPGGYSYPSN